MSAMRTGVLLSLLLVVTANGLQSAAPRHQPNLGIYAAELGGGLAGALGLGGTFAVVSLLYPAWIDDERPIHLEPAALAGISGSLALVGLAGGISVAGRALDQRGKLLPTLAYATTASAAGLGLWLASSALVRNGSIGRDAYYGMRYAGTALFVATPFAGVLGYNRSRPHEPVSERILPGSVTPGWVKDEVGVPHPAVDLKLVTIKF